MFEKQPLSEDMKSVLTYVKAHPGKTAEEIKSAVPGVSHASLLCLLDEGFVQTRANVGGAIYFVQ